VSQKNAPTLKRYSSGLKDEKLTKKQSYMKTEI